MRGWFVAENSGESVWRSAAPPFGLLRLTGLGYP